MTRFFGTTGLVAAMGIASVAVTAGAYAQGDVEAGKKVFARCAACHNIDQEKNKVGPYLVGVMGRKAGTAEGFSYSTAMKEAGEKGLVWAPDTLDKYLSDPKGDIPGNRMAFPGLKNDGERAAVIAYVQEASKKQ